MRQPNPQYSGLENSMDSTDHGVAESDTTERLSLSPPRDLWDNMKCTDIRIKGIPEEGERKDLRKYLKK